MTMLSYAPNAEDVVLARVFADREAGFYVDLGPGDPAVASVTRHFAERGWRGVEVTADSAAGDRLAAARPEAIVLLARLGAGGPAEGDAVDLGAVFAAHAPADGVDFLRIGAAAEPPAVIGTTDWKAVRPRLILVHAVDEAGAPSHFGWHRKLVQGGYRLALFDGISRFYVREEDAEAMLPRLQAPANVRDDWRPAAEQDRFAALEAALAAANSEVSAARDAQSRLQAARDAAVAEASGLRQAVAAARLAAAEATEAAEAMAARIAELETQPAGGGLAGRLVTALRGRSPARDR